MQENSGTVIDSRKGNKGKEINEGEIDEGEIGKGEIDEGEINEGEIGEGKISKDCNYNELSDKDICSDDYSGTGADESEVVVAALAYIGGSNHHNNNLWIVTDLMGPATDNELNEHKLPPVPLFLLYFVFSFFFFICILFLLFVFRHDMLGSYKERAVWWSTQRQRKTSSYTNICNEMISPSMQWRTCL